MALNVWVTFVRKVDANNFKKSPNLVTLLRCFVLVVCLFICLPLSLLVLHLTASRCCLHCISLFTSKMCLFVATFKSREFRSFSKSFLFSTLINVPIYLLACSRLKKTILMIYNCCTLGPNDLCPILGINISTIVKLQLYHRTHWIENCYPTVRRQHNDLGP